MMDKRNTAPTMKDVAREAKVSLGTVSKVMNGIPVGESYRRRVEAASKKLGYQIDDYARGLRTRKTYAVAIIVPNLNHPYYASLVEAVTEELTKRDFRPILMLTECRFDAEQQSIALAKKNRVDGVIGLTFNPSLEIDLSVPFVSIDRRYGPDIPCITSDNYGGGQLAAEKLIERGCRKLLFLRIGSDVSSEADRRGAGFENICRLHNIPYEMIITADNPSEATLFQSFDRLLIDGIPAFDGIFCNTDILACRVYRYLSQHGVHIPEEVQLIGFDGIMNFVTDTMLCSSIVQPIHQIAGIAVETLFHKDSPAWSSVLCLPVHFSEGGTTRTV